MKIETLNTLLNQHRPGATAYVKEAQGRRKEVVVTFTPGGKGYGYKGSVLDVAESLELIPEVFMGDEAERVIARFTAGETEVIAYSGCQDTVSHTYRHPAGLSLLSEPAGKDEFDRPLVKLTWGINKWV